MDNNNPIMSIDNLLYIAKLYKNLLTKIKNKYLI